MTKFLQLCFFVFISLTFCSAYAQPAKFIVNNATLKITENPNIVFKSTDLIFKGSAVFDGDEESLIFNGENSRISNTTGNNIEIYNLSVEKDNAGVDLSLEGTDDFEIKNSLNINNGRIDLRESAIILESTATMTETATGRAYVSDPNVNMGYIEITRNVPVATVNNFGNIGLTLSNPAVSPGNVTVRRYHYSASSPNFPPVNRSTFRVYEVQADVNAGLGVNAVFRYRDEEVMAPQVENNLIIYKTASTIMSPTTSYEWSLLDANLDMVAKTLTVNNMDTLFTFTASDELNQPLPISLYSFTSYCKDKKQIIEWQTASEINNSHFILEKSYDGKFWESVSIINGKGFSNTLVKYAYTDDKNEKSAVFYRLIQVDFDGTEEVHKTISAAPCNENEYSFDFEPVSPQGENNVKLWITSSNNERVHIEIFDLNGKVLYASDEYLSEGKNLYHLNCQIYSNAMYTVRATVNRKTISKRLIVNLLR